MMASLRDSNCANVRPVVIKRMPQAISVPGMAGITMSGVVATMLPTGAMLPG